MSALFALLVLLALLGLTTAAPSASWKRVQRVDDLSSPIRLTIGLKQQRLAELESLVNDISNPRSANYRQHLALSDTNAMVAPSSKSIQAVQNWLQQADVPLSTLEWSGAGEWLNVHTTVAGAEKLLGAKYYTYKHVSGATVIRCESYSLPDSVRSHIDVVGPTTRFPALRTPLKHSLPSVTKQSSKVDAASPCADGVSPDCIRAVYGVNYTATSGQSSAAVNGFIGQYISLDDLNQFLKTYSPARVGFVPAIVGPNNGKQPGVEASLDIQYITALTPGVQNITFWYTAGEQPKNPGEEPFLVWLSGLANSTSPPLVISTSYGDDEDTVDYDYAMRVNAEFIKAGGRGITLLFSSGDSGVGGNGASCSAFVPTFPAGSPWVTAVGGTELVSAASLNETSASFSSGGFANYFASPDYQKDAVSAYLNTYGKSIPDQKYWNATGRAFPDIAALGVDFPITVDGQTFPVDGTSCSAPTFAGLITLLNDVLLAKGEPPLGFLNHLIYQYGQVAFKDVTTGSNPGCGTRGFRAAQYWDPVTGFGTPNWPEWLKLVDRLSTRRHIAA